MLTVLGEALVDLVDEGERRYRAHPGGSPLNVAVGLGRLGHRVTLRARVSADGFGRLLRAHLAAAGVDPAGLVAAAEPSTLAVASLDAAGAASYDFWTNGTADWQWSAAELAAPLPAGTRAVHTGSLATVLPPGAPLVADWLAGLRRSGSVLVSYDPNVRPALLDRPEAVRPGIERLVATADLVKASADDLGWLYPGEPAEEVAERWAATGPALVVVTLGGSGVLARTSGGAVAQRPAVPVHVVDTVGAGDAFAAGLLGGLADADLLDAARRGTLADLNADELVPILDWAALVAALTCARSGADPPTRAEVEAATGPPEPPLPEPPLPGPPAG